MRSGILGVSALLLVLVVCSGAANTQRVKRQFVGKQSAQNSLPSSNSNAAQLKSQNGGLYGQWGYNNGQGYAGYNSYNNYNGGYNQNGYQNGYNNPGYNPGGYNNPSNPYINNNPYSGGYGQHRYWNSASASRSSILAIVSLALFACLIHF